jgi:phospholipid transport system substrate-binding protein
MRSHCCPVLLFCFLAPLASAQSQSPNEMIEEAMSLMGSALEDRRDDLEADDEAVYALIDEVLLPRFDRRYAARLVLGRNVRTASEEQLERFIEAFYSNMVRKYADGLLGFDQDQIDVLAFRGDDTEKRVLVKTMVALDDGTKVPVDYRLVRRSTGWLMFDVVIEGISYVQTFRTEIGTEIQGSSLDAVITRLEGDAGMESAE